MTGLWCDRVPYAAAVRRDPQTGRLCQPSAVLQRTAVIFGGLLILLTSRARLPSLHNAIATTSLLGARKGVLAKHGVRK